VQCKWSRRILSGETEVESCSGGQKQSSTMYQEPGHHRKGRRGQGGQAKGSILAPSLITSGLGLSLLEMGEAPSAMISFTTVMTLHATGDHNSRCFNPRA
jgi:hypothetical protein